MITEEINNKVFYCDVSARETCLPKHTPEHVTMTCLEWCPLSNWQMILLLLQFFSLRNLFLKSLRKIYFFKLYEKSLQRNERLSGQWLCTDYWHTNLMFFVSNCEVRWNRFVSTTHLSTRPQKSVITSFLRLFFSMYHSVHPLIYPSNLTPLCHIFMN